MIMIHLLLEAVLLLYLGLVSDASSGIYVDNGLDQTILSLQINKRESRELQYEILHLLGLHRPPHPSHSQVAQNSAPKFMLDVYKSLLEKGDEGELKSNTNSIGLNTFNVSDEDVKAIDTSNIIISFVNHGHHLSHGRHDKARRFWFDVSEVPLDESMLGAELRLYKEATYARSLDKETIILNVYQFSQNPTSRELEPNLISSRNISQTYEGWIVFNVTKTMREWMAFPDSNLGLYISLSLPELGHDLHPADVGLIGAGGTEENQPFLVAYFTAHESVHKHQRTTRAARRENRDYSSYVDQHYWSREFTHSYVKRNCQRKTFYVSFRDLGWQHWVIAPDGYPAFFCEGECSFPLTAHMNASNHAIVQTLVHLMNPHKIPKPSCAPTNLSSISVLYIDDSSNVVLKKYKNMVVKSCGCH